MFVYEEKIYNTKSAEVVVPYLMELFKPISVLDIGCGKGTWLSIFLQFPSVKNVKGIDGLYINSEDLIIPSDYFAAVDLNQSFDLKEKFDIVISLEVAEHLDEKSASTFVESITQHGNIVVFSAAIPGQGGQNHINEQWPEYWRLIFSENGFDAYDVLREVFWDNSNVEWWYKQNMFVFIRRGFQPEQFIKAESKLISYVHPEMLKAQEKYLLEQLYAIKKKNEKPGLKQSVYNLIKALKTKFTN